MPACYHGSSGGGPLWLADPPPGGLPPAGTMGSWRPCCPFGLPLLGGEGLCWLVWKLISNAIPNRSPVSQVLPRVPLLPCCDRWGGCHGWLVSRSSLGSSGGRFGGGLDGGGRRLVHTRLAIPHLEVSGAALAGPRGVIHMHGLHAGCRATRTRVTSTCIFSRAFSNTGGSFPLTTKYIRNGDVIRVVACGQKGPRPKRAAAWIRSPVATVSGIDREPRMG